MNIKTYRGLFGICILICVLLSVVFYFIRALCFHSVYDPTIWLTLKLLQMCFCFAAGIMIRKNKNEIMLENDGTKKKYMKYIFILLAVSVILFIFPDIIAIPYLLAEQKLFAVTGLYITDFFSYLDLLGISICLGCAFFQIKQKEKCSE